MTPIADKNADLVDSVEEDLAGLIQDEGLTPSRMQIYGQGIMRLYGSTNARYVVRCVTELAEEMEQDQYSKALASALGITSGGSTLSERREFLTLTKKNFDKSEDTLRRWERRAMKVLARKIVEDVESKKRDGAPGADYLRFTSNSSDPAEQIDGLRVYIKEQDDKIYDLTRELVSISAALTKLTEGVWYSTVSGKRGKAPGSQHIHEAGHEAIAVFSELANESERAKLVRQLESDRSKEAHGDGMFLLDIELSTDDSSAAGD